MSLTDTKIRSLKPSDKPFKVSDSHGLYLLVKPAVHVTGISSTVLRVKNHVLHSVPTQSSPSQTPVVNVKVFAKCWY